MPFGDDGPDKLDFAELEAQFDVQDFRLQIAALENYATKNKAQKSHKRKKFKNYISAEDLMPQKAKKWKRTKDEQTDGTSAQDVMHKSGGTSGSHHFGQKTKTK